MNQTRSITRTLAFLTALLALASCGGSDPSAPTDPGTSSATITGSVFAAPVSGASLVVLDSSGTTTVAGPVSTASDGTYRISIPSSALASPLLFSSLSGTFTDEATGTADVAAGNLAAFVPGGTLASGASVNLDPSTTIVAYLVRDHARTLDESLSVFSTAFTYTPDASLAPRNVPSSAETSTGQRLAGIRAAAFSQLTAELSLSPNDQFELLAAIAGDLADGALDGMNAAVPVPLGAGSLPEDIQNRYAHALVSALSDTAVNLTGLGPADIGALPFGKVALTNTYRVQYLPGTMAASQGKTTFKLKATNAGNGSAATGLSVTLMPKMHMATMSHMTPVDTVSDNGDGTYSCTVYYLMAGGPGMGYWELKVMLGMESATFYPAVGMAMGGVTARATLKGQSDLIASSMGSEKRSYYLFPDGITTGTTSTFSVFIAAKEGMMNFPALSTAVTTTLHDQNAAPWSVDAVDVYASIDGSTWTSAPASETAQGHWSLSGLTGLVSGQTGTVYVKLNVNGEDKTTDGNVSSGSNGYAVIVVKP